MLFRSTAVNLAGVTTWQAYNAATRTSIIEQNCAGASDSGRIDFWTKPSGGSVAMALTLDSSQNATFAGSLGIGTTPSYKLHILTTGNNGALINNGTNQLYFGNTGGNPVVGTLTNHDFYIVRNGSAVATFEASNATFAGTVKPKASTGSAVFALDASGQSLSINDNATATPFTGSGVINFAGLFIINDTDRKSTRLNSCHVSESRMPSSA